MHKFLTVFILFLAILLLQAPTAEAWSGKTHPQIIDQVYYSLPADAQHNLILQDMRDGSTAPDLKFFDFSNHKYPASYNKALYWLDKGEKEYKTGDYHNASYSFGVASHYISDSFSAPHCMLKSGAYHSLYELQGGLISPHVTVTNGDFNNMMENTQLNGQYSWNSWMMGHNNCYVQSDLDNATTASYLAIKQHLNI